MYHACCLSAENPLGCEARDISQSIDAFFLSPISVRIQIRTTRCEREAHKHTHIINNDFVPIQFGFCTAYTDLRTLCTQTNTHAADFIVNTRSCSLCKFAQGVAFRRRRNSFQMRYFAWHARFEVEDEHVPIGGIVIQIKHGSY